MSNWYALHTKSRHEFVVQKELQKKNIEVFLPTVDKLRRWSDRKKIVTFPLFSGYLFAYLELIPEKMVEVLKIKGVVRILGTTPLEPTPIPDAQIENLKKAVLAKCDLDPYPYLKEGKTVRIKRGPLEGVTGILVSRENVHRLVLNIDLLQRSVSLKIDATEVEVI